MSSEFYIYLLAQQSCMGFCGQKDRNNAYHPSGFQFDSF